MRPVVRPADSVFAVKTVDQLTKTAARGEAVDFDKYDETGQLNPHHGWTLDFPESVPPSERTYSNKAKAQGWYDDPENEPAMRGTRWGGTGDYADREFYEKTRPYSQAIDPNREAVMNPSGALGQYGVGNEDLNEYRDIRDQARDVLGLSPRITDQTGYPTGSGWDVRPPANLDINVSPRSMRHLRDVQNIFEDTNNDEDGPGAGWEDEDYGDAQEERHEDEGSHPEQHHLTSAGFGYHPDQYGDRYTREDHNGHTHVVQAPNPRYGSMDTWHYSFQPHNEWHVSDPYVSRDASREGPRTMTFSASSPEEAHNLHQNLGDDLSELASRGWGIHRLELQNAREDNRTLGGSGHLIEAHRRDANDTGYDRLLRGPGGWSAAHVPDPTSEDRFPLVSPIASSSTRRVALDAADMHNATGTA